jgi:hypothetical protein
MLRKLSIRLLPFRLGIKSVFSSKIRTKPGASPRGEQSTPSGPTVARVRYGANSMKARYGASACLFLSQPQPRAGRRKALPAQRRWSPDFLLSTSFPLLGLEPTGGTTTDSNIVAQIGVDSAAVPAWNPERSNLRN